MSNSYWIKWSKIEKPRLFRSKITVKSMSEKSIIKRDYDELVKSKIHSVIILTVKFGIKRVSV